MNELTVKEYASAERVTPRTVWRWIDKGAVPVRRTPGGGVRIPSPQTSPRVTLTDNKRQPSR
jgi:excisionase family DNA binding protein